MKKYLGILSLIIVLFAACGKEHDPEKQAREDDAAIQSYISSNNITAIKHSSGLYYQVMEEGSGLIPTLNSNVEVKYIGKLLNGNIFDQSKDKTVKFPLYGVIKGWQIGIPLIKKGGKIKLLVPSALAYGNSSPGAGIPKNAVLVFDVELIDVK
jgi:FKBP-type peptidyl-prolyl cis-trans isomerase FkpA